MDANILLETLRQLEVAMHQREARVDTAEQLLHPRFREIGRSGRMYTKAEIIASFANESQTQLVWSQDFQVEPLSDGLSLLTYKSAHINGEGELERHAYRSSIWRFTASGWQMLFHQGTPTDAFPKSAG
jgi:hypothetical protein